MQLMATSKNPYSIGLIKEPSELVQLNAVNQKSDAIKYIKQPTFLTQLTSQSEGKLMALMSH